jgi:hypothetical protein
MRKWLLLLLFATLGLAWGQANPALFSVKKVYVEKMENNLDQYITSEISRQFHGSLEIVLDRAHADGVITGVNIGAQDTTKATIRMVDPSGKTVLWSATADDRDKTFMKLKHSGEQKIAEHLVAALKKAMQPK